MVSKRKFIKQGALWLAAAPFILTPRKSEAQVVLVKNRFAFQEAAASGCTTEQLNTSGTTNGYFPFGGSSARAVAGIGPFTWSGSGTCCSVRVPLYTAVTPTFNMVAYLYTGDGVDPDAPTGGRIGTGSDAVAATSLAGSEPGTGVLFSNMSAAPGNGVTYWVCIETSAQDGEVRWPYQGSFASGLQMTWNGSVWSTESQRTGKVVVFT